MLAGAAVEKSEMAKVQDNKDEVLAFLLITTSREGTQPLLERLRADSLVEEAHIVYGDVDIVAKVKVPRLQDLTKFVMDLRKTEWVEGTNTLIALLEGDG
ncbi:MAG: hypothetical protein Kow0069_33590 [Promethearchaeota archaeon]